MVMLCQKWDCCGETVSFHCAPLDFLSGATFLKQWFSSLLSSNAAIDFPVNNDNVQWQHSLNIPKYPNTPARSIVEQSVFIQGIPRLNTDAASVPTQSNLLVPHIVLLTVFQRSHYSSSFPKMSPVTWTCLHTGIVCEHLCPRQWVTPPGLLSYSCYGYLATHSAASQVTPLNPPSIYCGFL